MKQFNLDLFRPGDMLLTRNEGGFFGNQIRRNQLKAGFLPEDAKYTHIEVLALRDRINPLKFWSVRVAPPKTKLVNFPEFYKGRYIKIVRYKHYEDFNILKDVALWAVSHCNVPYDFPGIIRFIFIWVKQKTSKWFCSENAIWSLQQVYPDAFGGMLPSDSMPAHGLDGEWVDEIWEGYIPE